MAVINNPRNRYHNTYAHVDPTANKVIENPGKQRLDKCLYDLRMVARLYGFEFEGRVVLKDKKTGEVWR